MGFHNIGCSGTRKNARLIFSDCKFLQFTSGAVDIPEELSEKKITFEHEIKVCF